ncbi:MAG TPA: Npt1/Npt2 family nucleotide transporter [Azospirillaceae bacterium]|nr:Npt1/Npt2 family nucleotide transporter [Azospirillaceae bacterium]
MTMPILRFLKLESGELGKVLQFTALAMLMQAGLGIGTSVGDALFVAKAGPENVAYSYILTPLVMLVYTPVMTYLTGRYGIDRVADVTNGTLILGGLFFWYALGHVEQLPAPFDLWIYYGVKIYASVWYIGLYTLFWNLADEYFDIQDAKRLFAIFSAGSALGCAIGGLTVSNLADVLRINDLYLLWTATALLTVPLSIRIRRRFPKLSELEDDGPAVDRRFITQMRDVGAVVKSSAFVPVLIGVFALIAALMNLNEYQYMKVFSEGRTEADLAQLFGQLYGTVNILYLFISLFVFSRLVLRIGVRNVAMIVPFCNLAVFTFFFIDFGFPAGVASFILFHGLIPAIEFNNNNFLYNGINPRFKQQVRTFVEGLCEPSVSCFMGIFLLLVAPRLASEQLSAVGIGMSALLIVLVLVLRQLYRASMIVNLRRGWLDFSRREEEVLKDLDERQIEQLEAMVRWPETPQDDALTALRILFLNVPERQLATLIAFLRRADEQGRQAARPFLRRFLESGNSEFVLRVVDELYQSDLFQSPSIIEELGSFRLIDRTQVEHLSEQADTPSLRGASIVPLWFSSETKHGLKALSILDDLRSGNEESRCAAVRALGHLRLERFSHLIVQFLADPSVEVQREALLALRQIGPLSSSRLVEPILKAISRADPDIRHIGMEVVGSSGDTAAIEPLLRLADQFTPFERRGAESVVAAMGVAAIPAIVSILQDRQYTFAARGIAARALSRLSFAQFQAGVGDLVRAELVRAYGALARNLALCADLEGRTGAGRFVLARLYADLELASVEFALLLLTLGGDLPDFELLSSSLRSSNPKVRGNAIETLEQGCDRATFQLILPLVDGRPREARLAAFADAGRIGRLTPEQIVGEALSSSYPLEAAAAVQALWDDSPEDAAPVLREKLHGGGGDVLHLTVLDLLGIEGKVARMTVVQRLAALARVPLLETVGMQENLSIAQQGEQCLVEDETEVYEVGERSDCLYLLLSGAVTLHRPGGGTETLTEGLFGMEALTEPRYLSRAVMSRGELLVIPRGAVLAAAQTYPRLAMRLFESRVVAA